MIRVSMISLIGHTDLRHRLAASAAAGTLPGSMLFVGPRGVGKQRLALWLGQLLLCTGEGERPCGRCQQCRFSMELTHPDLHWFFPRPRLKDSDASPDDYRRDVAEAIAERVRDDGLYAPPSGSEGIFIQMVRAIVQAAAVSPALAKRKVFVIGDADRMVSQEGADQAANAFLKLLEEPPADTQIILTSSEPGALLPTIRSRVVTVRVPLLSDAEVRKFVAEPAVSARIGKGAAADDPVLAAAGAPGRLFGLGEWAQAVDNARRLVEAATSPDAGARYRLAFGQGASKARGSFSDTLDALTVVLHERARGAVRRRDDAQALASAKAVEAVERAKEMAQGNVNPQLLTASLLNELAGALR